MSRQDEIRLVKLSIANGSDSPEDVVERLGPERTFAVITAALTLAVRYKFPPTVSTETLRDFAGYLQSRFRGGEGPISPLTVEAVVRAGQGDQSKLNEIPTEEAVSMMFLVTYAIMSKAKLTRQKLDSYIDQVMDMAGSPAE